MSIFIYNKKKRKESGEFNTPKYIVILGTNVEIVRRASEESAGTGIGIGRHCPLAF
jgi:hypothetical protein